MKLLPCGITVRTKISNIEGMITAACIRFDKVTYEISYFSNSEQKVIWMHEKEFTTDSKKQTIGFNKNP